MSLWAELQRRKVVRAAIAYAIVSWLLVQVAVTIEEPLGLPDWTETLVIALLAAGFPVALLLSWVFDLTPEGPVRVWIFEQPAKSPTLTNQHLISTFDGSHTQASFSPDGSMIAFVSDARRLVEYGPVQRLDRPFDMASDHHAIWKKYERGNDEIWMAELTQ